MRFFSLTATAVMLAASAFAQTDAEAIKDKVTEKVAEKSARMIAADAVMASQCDMQENVNLSVSFNFSADSPTQAKEKFDRRIKEIDDMGKRAGLKKMSQQSLNYSINSNYGDGGNYQMSGSVSYLLSDADGAFKFLELLKEKNMQGSVNVNKYRNGGGGC